MPKKYFHLLQSSKYQQDTSIYMYLTRYIYFKKLKLYYFQTNIKRSSALFCYFVFNLLQIKNTVLKQQQNIHVFGISGLGADKRVFNFLKLNYDFTAIDWIEPLPKETIASYAQRLINEYQLNTESNIVIVGVSFGGMIASEMHPLLKPQKTIVISSATKTSELPRLFSLVKRLYLSRWIPNFLLKPNIHIAAFLFGTKRKKLLKSIIKDTNIQFLRWGMYAITNWIKAKSASDIITVHGTKDKIIPKKGEKTYTIKNGGHFMIVDLADEVSTVINEEILKLKKY